ncbi:MAG: hypothetical protein V1719_00495 [Patescibacteria group bacterium]
MSQDNASINPQTYAVGETANDEGAYVCVPCGLRIEMKLGNIFPSCTSCLEQGVVMDEDEGTWEKLSD